MSKVKRNWDLLTEDERRTTVNEIINFFATERGETIGVVAAENILDMFLQNTGLLLYNKGIDDAREFLRNHIEELSIDMEVSLKK